MIDKIIENNILTIYMHNIFKKWLNRLIRSYELYMNCDYEINRKIIRCRQSGTFVRGTSLNTEKTVLDEMKRGIFAEFFLTSKNIKKKFMMKC